MLTGFVNTELTEKITELGKNMELNIDGLRETLSAKIDDLQLKLFFGMLAIAVYVKMDTDANAPLAPQALETGDFGIVEPIL